MPSVDITTRYAIYGWVADGQKLGFDGKVWTSSVTTVTDKRKKKRAELVVLVPWIFLSSNPDEQVFLPRLQPKYEETLNNHDTMVAGTW